MKYIDYVNPAISLETTPGERIPAFGMSISDVDNKGMLFVFSREDATALRDELTDWLGK